jgi:hypothetical protein
MTMDLEKLVDSVKFSLKSVRQLSDRFVEVNDNTARSFESVRQDIDDLAGRIERLEIEVVNLCDKGLIAASGNSRSTDLPVGQGARSQLIPVLNLSMSALLDVYRNTPSLLQPFARPCSLTGRTLSGSISEIELEVFAQGTSWMIELQDCEWVLLPRPGMLQRQTQVESLSRLFDVEAQAPLPGELELLRAGMATAVEHGRRWYLKERGAIGIFSDPLQHSIEQRLRLLEEKIKAYS